MLREELIDLKLKKKELAKDEIEYIDYSKPQVYVYSQFNLDSNLTDFVAKNKGKIKELSKTNMDSDLSPDVYKFDVFADLEKFTSSYSYEGEFNQMSGGFGVHTSFAYDPKGDCYTSGITYDILPSVTIGKSYYTYIKELSE